VIERCTGHIYAFLLMFQEVRPIRKTCNQLSDNICVGMTHGLEATAGVDHEIC
jgi:hypothetical protein